MHRTLHKESSRERRHVPSDAGARWMTSDRRFIGETLKRRLSRRIATHRPALGMRAIVEDMLPGVVTK